MNCKKCNTNLGVVDMNRATYDSYLYHPVCYYEFLRNELGSSNGQVVIYANKSAMIQKRLDKLKEDYPEIRLHNL